MPTKCYRLVTDRSHNHRGPTFYKCLGCKQIICHECIGRNLPAGGVLCVECAVPIDVQPVDRSTFNPPLNTRIKRYQEPLAANTGKVIYIAVNATSSLFTQVANLLLIVLGGLGAPFRHRQSVQRTYYTGIDVSFTNYADKVRFTLLLIVIVVVASIAILGVGEAAGLSHFRVLLTLTATGVCWGITTVYLQYFFDGALGRPVSQILAYIIAFFIALMFGLWLLNQRWLDSFFGF